VKIAFVGLLDLYVTKNIETSKRKVMRDKWGLASSKSMLQTYNAYETPPKIANKCKEKKLKELIKDLDVMILLITLHKKDVSSLLSVVD